MKLVYITAALLLIINFSIAQQKMLMHHSGDTLYSKVLTAVDSVKLDSAYAKFNFSEAPTLINIKKAMVDSITFTTSAITATKIFIIYNGTDDATIINPYASQGISITATGGIVSVTAASGISNLEYHLLGSSSNGKLTIATDNNINLVLNNLSLTNPSGAAILVTGGKLTNFSLTAGTTNTLSDGSASTNNGTINTDGPIAISNTGILQVAGIKKHGINTSSTISILNGSTSITSAASDGLHSEGFAQSGGSLTISALADGIDAGNGAIAITGGTINVTSTSNDVKAIKTGNNTVTIDAGTITLTVSGAQSKGISAKGNISINNGNITATLSGATVLTASGSGYDPSYATAIKSDAIIAVTGGTINFHLLVGADGGKGFSADGAINISGGIINVNTAGNGGTYINELGVADAFSTSALTSDVDVNISGGTLTLVNTGASGKGISSDVDVHLSGTAQLNITNSGNAGKGIKADSSVYFNGAVTTINLSGATVLEASGSGYDPSYPTGVKTTGSIIVNSGNIQIQGTAAATGTKGLSADASITVNNGTINIITAGSGAVYTNALGVTDSYSSAAFSADSNISIIAGNITTSSSGNGGKGLKADGNIYIGTATSSPTLNITTTGNRFLVSGTDYSHPKTIVADGIIVIDNGNNTINSTDDGIHSDSAIYINGGTNIVSAISSVSTMGEGVEAPIIIFTGGVTRITASNDGINATYGTVAGGTEQNDGSNLTISGGIVIVDGKDGIDSNGNITISGGTTVVCGVTNGPEEGLDFNGAFNMNGGTIIVAGSNSNMTKNFSATSTQRTMYLRSSAQLAATSLFHIRNTSGTEMVTFKPKNAVYYFHFSSPAITASTGYQVYFGGTYTGGSFVGNSSGWGLYNGGTYSTSGGTLKATFTTSAVSTLNSISF